MATPDNATTLLITQERAQKLDLLIHLIANLKQALIVYGPSGIGKTTLLNVFRNHNSSTWPIIFLTATEQLSFEAIQEQLLKNLPQNDTTGRSLNQLLRDLARLKRKVVLVCDDAGRLVPGLMAMLIQYAETFSGLRVVFALTDEQLHAKSRTDPNVEDCHLIELPRLSIAQCHKYLHYLRDDANHDALTQNFVAQNISIESALVEQVYKQTRGVPGAIVRVLPTILQAASSKRQWLYLLGFTGVLLAGTVGLMLYKLNTVSESSASTSNSSLTQTLATIPSGMSGQRQPPFRVQQPTVPPTALPMVLPQKQEVYKGYARTPDADALDEFKPSNQAMIAQAVAQEPLKVEILPTEAPIATVAPDNLQLAEQLTASVDTPPAKLHHTPATRKKTALITPKPTSAHLKTEPALTELAKVDNVSDAATGNRYTLQVMSFTQLALAEEYLRQHQTLSLRMVKGKKVDGRDKYIIIHGDFASKEQAEAAKKRLPTVLKNAWARKI